MGVSGQRIIPMDHKMPLFTLRYLLSIDKYLHSTLFIFKYRIIMTRASAYKVTELG